MSDNSDKPEAGVSPPTEVYFFTFSTSSNIWAEKSLFLWLPKRLKSELVSKNVKRVPLEEERIIQLYTCLSHQQHVSNKRQNVIAWMETGEYRLYILIIVGILSILIINNRWYAIYKYPSIICTTTWLVWLGSRDIHNQTSLILDRYRKIKMNINLTILRKMNVIAWWKMYSLHELILENVSNVIHDDGIRS